MNQLVNLLGTASVALLSQGEARTFSAATDVAQRPEMVVAPVIVSESPVASSSDGRVGLAASTASEAFTTRCEDVRDAVIDLARGGQLDAAKDLWRGTRDLFDRDERYEVDRELARKSARAVGLARSSVAGDLSWLRAHVHEYRGRVLLVRDGSLVAAGATLAEARDRAATAANGCLEVRVNADGTIGAP